MNKIRGLILAGILIMSAQLAHAWTASVAAPPTINGSHTAADYIVNFASNDVNGNNPFTRQVAFSQVTSSSDLKGRCISVINSYLTIDPGLPTTGFVVDLTTQPVVPPTQTQLDQAQWLSDYANFKHFDTLFEPVALSTSGIYTTSADPVALAIFVALRKKVHDNFQPQYINYIFP